MDIATVTVQRTPAVEDKPVAAAAATPACPAASTTPAAVSQKVLTTPSVRKIAKENKLDLSQVRGTGPKGRILKEDVLRFLKGESAPVAAKAASPAAPSAPVSAPVTVTAAADTVIPIRGVQRLMVKSMNAANAVQHLTLGEEVCFDKLRSLRAQLKPLLHKQHGVKLSYLPLVIKATSLALSQYPQLNASVNAEVTQIVQHASHNIGVAMDTPRGLLVPVIKNVQDKSIAQIAKELNELQEAATKGTITEAQLSGGTFSLSNIGECSCVCLFVCWRYRLFFFTTRPQEASAERTRLPCWWCPRLRLARSVACRSCRAT